MQSREAGVHYACCCTLPRVAAGHLWGFNKVFDFVWLAFRSFVGGFFFWGFYNQHVYSDTWKHISYILTLFW